MPKVVLPSMTPCGVGQQSPVNPCPAQTALLEHLASAVGASVGEGEGGAVGTFSDSQHPKCRPSSAGQQFPSKAAQPE